jgi:tetratricopeptide (TPR) repeat protein
MLNIPLGLRTALESGNCVLFLGAGIGEHARAADGKPAPDAPALAKDLAAEFSVEADDVSDLSRVAGIVELRRGRPELQGFLAKRLANLEPDDTLRWLFTIRWAAIFTTNYDRVIERAYELVSNPPQKSVTLTMTSDLVRHDPRFEVPICHIHGALFDSRSPQILITEDDYTRFRERRRMLFEFLKIEFAKSPVLYIGYSNRDPNWKMLIGELKSEFYPAPLPQSYRIAPRTDPLEAELLKAKNIETLDCTLQEAVDAAKLLVSTAPPDSSRYRTVKKEVPSDLQEAFDNNPAATARLLSSWTYVNQAPFHETPNIRAFLRGDRANWALVGSGEVFERDIEESIYEDLLDFATTSSRKPRALIVLAPAGYGVTTLLMTLAARLVKDNAGPVYSLRPGSSALEGDIEYAVTLLEGRSFLFVNNAADYVTAIQTMLSRLKDLESPAMFVLGERLNEWRQGHGKFSVKEYQIESLSDPEISRLLDLLEKHAELGALSPLPRDLQVAAIKQKHGKELLVALREATEGKSFDAILEDEFRGIQSSTARRLYLAVCCFHQHGAFARDALLAQLLDVPLIQLYQEANAGTEGVVIHECVNQAREAYGARTRHRTIASIVWERCASAEEKDALLNSALSSLNLNYGQDAAAFESFIRDDYTIDQIRTLDGKIRFFETACKKDPDSPYVRQHYARMLMREGRSELALGQVDLAIKMNPQVRVLYHTRGMVLKELALSVNTADIARRRLAQSETSFRRGLSLYRRDEYCYQGLAQLYLGWAKRASTPEESTEYVMKAEQVVSEGLTQVKVRYGLWIESSNIEAYLGNEPSRVQALEQAVRDTPGSIVSRYLLGRAYRKAGRTDDVLEVLAPIIKNHHDEFRSFVEFALCLAIKNKSYDESIAVLKLSTLYGYSDPRFLATLGGMLFMSGEFSEARGVFEESTKRDFTAEEMNKIQFCPWEMEDPNTPLRMNGKVVTRKAGYAFVSCDGFPVFLCPGSKFDGLVMEVGTIVSFQPAFSARGALAVAPLSIGASADP